MTSTDRGVRQIVYRQLVNARCWALWPTWFCQEAVPPAWSLTVKTRSLTPGSGLPGASVGLA